MTTIAFDGRTLVADTRSTSGGYPDFVQKIMLARSGLCVFAGSGTEQDVLSAFGWLLTNEIQGSRPKPTFSGPDTFTIGRFAIVGGKIICEEIGSALIPRPILTRFWAAGSGRDFALAAMHLGYNAIEAARVAAKLDVFTGFPANIVHFAPATYSEAHKLVIEKIDA